MADLHDRFRALDRMAVPDLRAEIDRRAAGAARQDRRPSVHSMTRARAGGLAATLIGGSLIVATVVVAGGLLAPAPSPTPAPTASPTSSAVPSGMLEPTLRMTGSLMTPRCGHGGIRLSDGRVLIVGGWDRDGAVVTGAELFDPVTETFHPVEGVTAAGDAVSLTRLPDGRVLIAGGRTGDDGDRVCGTVDDGMMDGRESASAFLFDPTTDTISPTGSLGVARLGHAAIRLDDGRVLVAGGMGRRDDGAFGELRSAELFDPATGAFEPTGSMTMTRGWGRDIGGGETRPDGIPAGNGRVIIVGDPTAPLEVYDPGTASFTRFAGEPGLATSSAEFASHDCQCVERIDLHTGELERVGAGRGGGTVGLPRNVQMGELLVVVSGEWVYVDDLATEGSTPMPPQSDWALPTLLGAGAVTLPVATALDPTHVLVAGGHRLSDVLGDAQILTLPSRE